MDAINLLIQEHQSHRKLFPEVEASPERYAHLRSELIHHVNEEEEVLYSHLLEMGVGEDEIRKAWEEHKLIMQLLQELDELPQDDKGWQAKFQTLKTLHLHHIDEEERDLFPKIEKALSDYKLLHLGKKIIEQKSAKSSDEILYPEDPGSHEIPPI